MAKVFWLLPRKDGKKFDMVLLGAPAPAPTALSLVHRAANRDLLHRENFNKYVFPFLGLLDSLVRAVGKF